MWMPEDYKPLYVLALWKCARVWQVQAIQNWFAILNTRITSVVVLIVFTAVAELWSD